MDIYKDSKNLYHNLPEHLILFDGVCNLCNAVVQFILKHDSMKKFKFGSLQSIEGQKLLKLANLPGQNFDTFVYFRNGKLMVKSTAALFVLKEMGGKFSWFFIFIILPKIIRDSIYAIVSKTRYSMWGKKNECMMPDPSFNDRFIS